MHEILRTNGSTYSRDVLYADSFQFPLEVEPRSGHLVQWTNAFDGTLNNLHSRKNDP